MSPELMARLFEPFFKMPSFQLYFETPGVAEAELEHDVRRSIRRLLNSASGDAPRSSHRFAFSVLL